MDSVLSELCALYNAALEERSGAWKKARKSVSLYDQCKSLTHVRHDDPEGFGKLHVKVSRAPLAHLDRAFNAFFRRLRNGEKPGFPRFRPHSRFQCIEVLDPRSGMVKVRGKTAVIKLKGIPCIKIRLTRPLPDGVLKTLRIVRRPNGCTVDLTYAVEKQPLTPCEKAVGIDMGVRKRMMLSTGECIVSTAVDNGAVIRQQQRVARCKRGSRTRQKQVRQLARLRRRQHVRNRNACHRFTTDFVRRFGTIAVEKLNIQQMTQSAGAKKRHLNRSIQEQTWGLLRQQLTYKAEWAGRAFVEVNPAYTSQDCSRCGSRHNPGTSEIYWCPTCGLKMDRDHNAALNILRAGTLALASRQNGIGDAIASSM